MIRTSPFALFVLLSVAAVPLSGCRASLQAGGSADASPPPPPPPPPPPAPSSPPPATPPPAADSSMKVPGGAKLEGSKVPIPGNIVYETGKAKIKPESEPTLTQLKTFLDENPQVTQLRVEGHTDSDGDAAMNTKLSAERALAVVKWLEGKGLPRERLLAVGFGANKPLKPNDSKENKEQNRRTEFHIATLNGKNFLGRDPTGGGTVIK